MALAAGPVVGGAFLAFPAILAASLTLVAEQGSAARPARTPRGAILGGGAMATFAAVVVGLLGNLAPGLVLALAFAAWLLTAVVLYFLIGRRLSMT